MMFRSPEGQNFPKAQMNLEFARPDVLLDDRFTPVLPLRMTKLVNGA